MRKYTRIFRHMLQLHRCYDQCYRCHWAIAVSMMTIAWAPYVLMVDLRVVAIFQAHIDR